MMQKSKNFNPRQLLDPANLLSLSRIPIVIIMMIFHEETIIFLILLGTAMITDLLDGYVARLRGPTRLGAILDPFCDKTFFVALLVFLVLVSGFSITHLVLLLLREIYMVLLFAIFAFHPKRKKLVMHIKARWPGKLTTAGQFVAILWLALDLALFQYVVLAVAALSVAAMIDYTIFIERIIRRS